MRQSSTCALVAVLLLGACGTTDTNPSAPTDLATAAGGHGGHDGHGRRFHQLDILLLPPCDTTPVDTIPVDTIPTDTIPTDTIPTDTTGTPGDTSGGSTIRFLGGSHGGNGDSHHENRHHRRHRSPRACFGDNASDRHGSHWFDGWRRWFNNHSTFGLIKVGVPADSDTTVSLRTKLHLVTPNTAYLVQYAADTIPDHACTDSSWVTVGPGAVLESILSDSNGNARQTLTEEIPALPPSFSIDVRFRVVDSATTGVALVSRCHRFTTRK
jgi:hypothetical protein